MSLIRILASLASLALTLPVPTIAAADGSPSAPAVECQVRGGLPNLLAKLAAGGQREIRVAYLGGSITAAPGWRVKTLAWLQDQFPDVQLVEIDAAIGGTGSDLGVFRVQQDALQHRPDLLLVEFAVNDGAASPEQIHRGMEGIVRQTWRANPETDIAFVYTLSEPMLEDARAGKCSRSASAMEELAEFYAIPSIHFGVDVAARTEAGTLVFKGESPGGDAGEGMPMVFSTDGVHPLVETGHELYAGSFARAFNEIRAAGASPAPHTLGEPLRGDHWEAAKLVPLSRIDLVGDWELLDPTAPTLARRFAKFMPVMHKASVPGAGLHFRFRGTVAGIYDLVGPDCGQVVVSVDDRSPTIVKRIDGYCTYPRLSKMQVAQGLSPDTIHEVTVTLDSEIPDKAAVLFERNRPDIEAHPERYEGGNWYVGSVMLIGELVE